MNLKIVLKKLHNNLLNDDSPSLQKKNKNINKYEYMFVALQRNSIQLFIDATMRNWLFLESSVANVTDELYIHARRDT